MDSLVALLDCDNPAYDSDSDTSKSSGIDADVDEASTSTEEAVESTTLGSSVKPQHYLLPDQEMKATPWSTWTHQKATVVHRKQTRMEGKIGRKKIQRRQKAVACLDNHAPPHSPHRSVKTVEVHLGIVNVFKNPHTDEVTLAGAKEVHELQFDLKAPEKVVEEGDCYWAELLLRPLSVGSVPPSGKDLLSNRQREDTAPGDMQTRSVDYESIPVDTDAIKVNSPVSENRTPAASGSPKVRTYEFCEAIEGINEVMDIVLVDLPKPRQSSPVPPSPLRSDEALTTIGPKIRSIHIEPVSPTRDTESVSGMKPQAESVADVDKGSAKAGTGGKFICREEALKLSVQGVPSRLVALQKVPSASNGPDRFLGLLDLVRKK